MKKRVLSLILVALCAMLALTGCVRSNTAVDETEIDRPTVVVKLGDEALTPPVETEETEATATPAPTESAEGDAAETAAPEETAAADLNVYNTVPAGATLTLTGEHASGIVSVCYRFDGAQPTVVKESSVDVSIPEDAKKLELYVIDGKGIASQWATYYLTIE